MRFVSLIFILVSFSFLVKTTPSPLGRKVELVEIATVISTLQPEWKKDHNKLNKLSNSILNNSIRTGIDWKLAIAIFYQESSLKLDPTNCLKHNKCNDLGIGQVRYSVWGKEFNLDRKRMLSDAEYAISKSFDVMHYYKEQYSNKELNWYTRYHSKTKEHRINYQYRLNHAFSKINLVLR